MMVDYVSSPPIAAIGSEKKYFEDDRLQNVFFRFVDGKVCVFIIVIVNRVCKILCSHLVASLLFVVDFLLAHSSLVGRCGIDQTSLNEGIMLKPLHVLQRPRLFSHLEWETSR